MQQRHGTEPLKRDEVGLWDCETTRSPAYWDSEVQLWFTIIYWV